MDSLRFLWDPWRFFGIFWDFLKTWCCWKVVKSQTCKRIPQESWKIPKNPFSPSVEHIVEGIQRWILWDFLWDPRGFFWDLKTWGCKKVPNLKKNPSRIPKKSLRISFQSLPTFVVEEQKDGFYGIRRDPWGFFGILWGIGVVMRYKNLRNLFETLRKGIFLSVLPHFQLFFDFSTSNLEWVWRDNLKV